jgi:hypothetical protein
MKYKVLLHFLSFVTVEVEAANQEEACEKAGRDFQKRLTPEEIMPHLTRLPDYDRTRLIKEGIDYDFSMSRILNPGSSGDWEIKKEIVPAGQSFALYDHEGKIGIGECAFDYPIVTLAERGKIWMSDSPLEVESYRGPVARAKGDCLVSGLGIGLLPTLIRDKADSIDIVELNRDVIDLVFPQIRTAKTRIINDDIFHYLDTTTKTYDFIHIDIWGDITAPVIEIEKARRKAARCLRPGGVTWCWLEELYDRIKNHLPVEGVSPGRLGRYQPCLICGNSLREDYGGLCATCAGAMGVKERRVQK